MIQLKNIQKIYPNGFCAIKNLNLTIKKGDIFGIIGYSGAGKSTLIRLINRLEEPTSGEIIINGKNILDFSTKELQKQRQKIGMIFQHFNLLASKNIFDNIAFSLQIAKWEKQRIKARVEELLELVGLQDKATFYPSQLSGGQKQRVAIARALANHPDILLCDEATSALDTQTTHSILELLQNIQKRLKITIVLITHQIEVVKKICNKTCVIHQGNIIDEGSTEEVFLYPKNPITKGLVSHLPKNEHQDIFPHIKNPHHTYELIFLDKNQNSPIITQAIKKFDIDINILFADFNQFHHKSLGKLIAEITGKKTQEALQWFASQKIQIKTFQKEIASEELL